MAEKYFNEMKKYEYVLPLQENPKERIMKILNQIPQATQLLEESQNYYKPIRNSIYVERKQKIPLEEDIYICECIPSHTATEEQLLNPDISFDCKEKCSNRMISTECEMNSCPCGIYCHNRQFQLHQDRAIFPFRAGDKGWGLRAAEFIPKGSFIIQYIGEIYSIKSRYGQQKLQKYSKNTCTYLMKLSSKEVIDPTEKGNMARFINHSCDPNCRTEKQNILGEIGVGIVALKNIEPGTELTFDYQFDVFKTPLMRCLCGAYNCKGYLGLVPLNFTQEEWENKLENMPCEICASNYENDDDTLILCDSCNLGFHIDCLTPKLDQVPQGDWFCQNCIEKQKKSEQMSYEKEEKTIFTLRSKKKAQFEKLSQEIGDSFQQWLKQQKIYDKLKNEDFLQQFKAQDNSIKNTYQLSQVELHVIKTIVSRMLPPDARISIFWYNNDQSYRNIFNRKIELHLIGTEFQLQFVREMIQQIQNLNQTYKENSGNIVKQFKIPAIFLKRVLGEYYCNLKNVEKTFQVKVQFNRNHITDDCYPIHFMTTLFLNGKNSQIVKAHQFIKEQLGSLVARRIYMKRNDIKIIINKLSYIKKKINPTEIRCCRDNALRDINHPFYTIYYKNKEVTFVGIDEEVRNAERIVIDIIQKNQSLLDNTISLNYLIPVCDKSILIDIKQRAERKFPGNKMIVYDPLYPRKKVSITLTSTYRYYNDFLKFIRRSLDDAKLFPKNFYAFQTQTLFEISKFFFKYLQNYIQTKSIVFMKHWDSISTEFDEHSMSYKSSMKILTDDISKDYEFLFYILRVNNLYTKDKMKIFQIDIKKFLEILKFTLKQKNLYGNLNFSVLKDPVSDKLPDDYENLVDKEKFQFVQKPPYSNYHQQHHNHHPNQFFQRGYGQRYNYRGRYYDPYQNRGNYDRPPLRYYNEYRPRRYHYDNFRRERFEERKPEPIIHQRKNSKKSSPKSVTSSLSSSEKSKKKNNEEIQKNKQIERKDVQHSSHEGSQNEGYKFEKFKKNKREFQSSRYYKTSIDSKSENEDIYSKERKNRRQRLGSSISLESEQAEQKDKNFYERKPERFNYNRDFRPTKNYYDDRKNNFRYRKYPYYMDYQDQKRFSPRRQQIIENRLILVKFLLFRNYNIFIFQIPTQYYQTIPIILNSQNFQRYFNFSFVQYTQKISF